MNKTGWVVAVVSLIVGSGLALGALAHVAGQGSGGGSGASAVVWMPETATVIGQLDVTRLSESEIAGLWLEALSARDAAESIDELRERTGIDPSKDVSRITFSVREFEADGESDSGSELRVREGAWGVALEGTFDRDSILQRISEARETTSEVYDGITLHYVLGHTHSGPEPDPDPDPDGDADHGARGVAVAFPDASNLLLLGEPDYVRDMVAAGLGRTSSVTSSPLLSAWQDGTLSEDTFWIVGHAGRMTAMLARRGDGDGNPLPPLESFAVSGRLHQDLALRARGDASDATAAQQLADVARGFLALGRLNENTTAELKSLLDTVSIGQVDDKVELSMTVPRDTLVQWLERGTSPAEQEQEQERNE